MNKHDAILAMMANPGEKYHMGKWADGSHVSYRRNGCEFINNDGRKINIFDGWFPEEGWKKCEPKTKKTVKKAQWIIKNSTGSREQLTPNFYKIYEEVRAGFPDNVSIIKKAEWTETEFEEG